MVKCIICNQKLKKITNSHLWYKHKMRSSEFVRQFPDADRGLIPWNRGETKETHQGLLKLSNTLKSKKKWNFSKWQKERPKIHYKFFEKNDDLAELIGIILGDGSLYRHARTENLRIICNSKDINYIQHIAGLIEKIFHKKPAVNKRKNENATVISLYQGKISKRLNIPSGNKIENNVGIPFWIFYDKKYMIKCLKGLFETDGCFHENKTNYTRIIEFRNICKKLRENVFNILLKLGFSPQFGGSYVRLAKKSEVYKFKELIDFRNYNCPLG